jgi:2-hydroxy-3-keto-5-methylthiopentenyl-1-phosphate phosphatase
MLVLCDFDGTITTEDVTNVLWDRYGIPKWRDVLLPPYRAGEATTLELMDRGWRVIDKSEGELLAVARETIGLRAGFVEFVEECDSRGWSFHVVSCGLDWYLDGFLPPGVAATSYTAVLEDGWRVRLPADCSLPPGQDFKIHVMRGLQARHTGEPTVFIGDGRNDLPVARLCDHVFAVRGSTLAHLCRREGVAVEEFESFETVMTLLTAARSHVNRVSVR